MHEPSDIFTFYHVPMFKAAFRSIAFQFCIWLIIFLFPLFSYNVRVLDPHFYFKECINNVFLVALFYLHMNILIPRYFVRNRIWAYAGFVLLAICFIAIEQHLVEYTTFKYISAAHRRPVIMPHTWPTREAADSAMALMRLPRQPWMGGGFGGFGAGGMEHEGKILQLPAHLFFLTLRKALSSALLILLAGGFIRIALELFKTERKRAELEKEKLEAELGFLKSQVNPHFLFNSLNSIYSLAHRNADATQEAILQLSQMMRYMIYESNTSQVPLEKELEYLQNYIYLKKLRLTPNIHIHYTVQGNIAGASIEPMLLIPFIENAFKHGISYAEQCDIKIVITISGQHELHLLVSNKVFKKETPEPGGIGLENVQKRLQLLYPGTHRLQVTEENNYYTTSLSVLLKNSAYA
ncbi:sensor histidine kinase [Deminuibacter soli]|uniref:Signal transduction histidine kinase internal region domain-containing protein n=1 Tax=Deminuibacter soli TaxID=2291815 RepID=A0A3E1NRA5_9BACT|nr:histidine kinase [Deminuibacter soli]RFM30489.1 hypothetical protein DXN05_05910 [Deminuibacter soli]